jgi:hypothetical protein
MHSRSAPVALQDSTFQIVARLILEAISCVEEILNDRLECTFQLAVRTDGVNHIDTGAWESNSGMSR